MSKQSQKARQLKIVSQGVEIGEEIRQYRQPAIDPLTPKTETQKRYISAIKNFKLVFGMGPAGTGKTYIAGAMAADALSNQTVDKIIITRPAVEAGENLGYLPGELMEKYEPYIQPFRDVLVERLGRGKVDYLLKSGQLEAAPLAFMRGRTFRNAYILLDEAQNTTPSQMKLFLTRIGDNCKVIVNGDDTQQDIKGVSGLVDATRRLSWIPSVKVIRFGFDDVVRSGLVAEILQGYETDLASH